MKVKFWMVDIKRLREEDEHSKPTIRNHNFFLKIKKYVYNYINIRFSNIILSFTILP